MIVMLINPLGKKDDPNYEQLRGHVPKSLARQFKQFCLDHEFDYSEGLEHILTQFFERIGKQEDDRPGPTP
jgi:hypothetical protein